MTALVITDGITRIPLVPGSNASVNGDKIATLPLVHRAPGELWQREAERDARTKLNYSNPRSRWDAGYRARAGLPPLKY